MPKDFDVIVVGTGIAGHCAALEALGAGARVLMLEFGASNRRFEPALDGHDYGGRNAFPARARH